MQSRSTNVLQRSTCTIFTQQDCYKHNPGAEHPDRESRLSAISEALRTPEFSDLTWRIADPASTVDLEAVHDHDYLEKVQTATGALRDLWNLDKDTIVSADSYLAARAAAGAVCSAVDATISGKSVNAFCLVRPPGHHAERRHALGFCLVNNIAVGAARARNKHGLRRIAIVDIDAHHGNGAQNIFWTEPDFFVASIHQHRLSFSTGDADERGAYGNILNIPLRAGDGSAEFRDALRSIVSRLYDFRPEIILVAAGFDAHRDDPLSDLMLSESDFSWAAAELSRAASKLCNGRLVASLEGGYNLSSLARSAAGFVRAMKGAHEAKD